MSPLLYPSSSPSDALSHALRERRWWLLVDENTQEQVLPVLARQVPELVDLPRFVVPAGEEHKTPETALVLAQWLTQAGAMRADGLLVLGGGVLCDLGAWVASVYQRGMGLVLVPTTLLAMVDAAWGGKTGLDFCGLKNQLGTFYQAQFTLVFPELLSTLPEEEWGNGWMEMVKHAWIDRPERLSELGALAHPKALLHRPDLILNSTQIKLHLVEADPFDRGVRRWLNAGHTVGHALEALWLEKGMGLGHGRAVAAGLWLETGWCVQQNLLEESDLLPLQALLRPWLLPEALKSVTPHDIWKKMTLDKKNQPGAVLPAVRTREGMQTQLPMTFEQWQRTYLFISQLV